MAIDPRIKNAGMIVIASVSGSLATAMWMSTRKVDLYALFDHVGTLVQDISTLVATLVAIGTLVLRLLNSSTERGIVTDLKQLAEQPGSGTRAVITEDNPAGHALAAMPGPVVVAGTLEAEIAAKPNLVLPTSHTEN